MVLSFTGSLFFPAFPGAAILNHMSSCIIQDGAAQESQKEEILRRPAHSMGTNTFKLKNDLQVVVAHVTIQISSCESFMTEQADI